MKQEAYSERPKNSKLNTDLRASLCDIGDDNDKEEPFQKRDRSTSNENFGLPPLSNDDDNKDLCNDMNLDTDNYKSNENTFGSNLADKGMNPFGSNLADSGLNTNFELQG